MSKESKLVRRGSVYYLRKRVPSDLIGVILGPSGKPRREIWKSLKETSYLAAKRKLPSVLAILEGEFAKVRATMQASVLELKEADIEPDMAEINILALLERILSNSHSSYASLKKEPVHLLVELTESFLRDKERGSKRVSTMMAYRQSCELIEGFLGANKNLQEIVIDDIREFCDFLEQIPLNAKQRFPNKSVTEAVIEANSKDGVKRISAKSQSLLFNKVCSLFSYAVSIDWIRKTPVSPILFKDRFKYTTRKKSLFTVPELNQLFLGEWYQDIELAERKGLFWVPLIGLFHGCRLNEVCQLKIENIQKSQDVFYFAIAEDEDVHLKTSASNRNIPIHNELIKMGFLSFVESRRSNPMESKRLFPELKLASDNTFSSHFSKRFIRYRNKTLEHPSKATFHSFRHMMRDALRRSKVNIERVNALGGWAGSGGMEAHYGDGLLVEDLNADLQSVFYEGLILNHLYI